MRVNLRYTITSGVPINIYTGTGAADTNPWDKIGKIAARIVIQPLHGGSGLVYVMAGVSGVVGGVGRVPTVATDLTMELFPATATLPGGIYSDFDIGAGPQGIDISQIWIDGAHTGDVVVVSFDLKT